MLYCVVEDNGVGRIKAAEGRGAAVTGGRGGADEAKGMVGAGKRSFGMKITADRIAMLNKTQPYPASMTVTDLEEGTRVEIWLPLLQG
jgi:hypothetical protein